jgi:GGDEF domain-containing protein
MDLSAIQPQIVISVVLIVTAAAVALLVDFLKGRNEQLRVALAELQRRKQEETLPRPVRREVPPAPAPPVTKRAEVKPALERPKVAGPETRPYREPVRRQAAAPVRRMDREDMQRAQERAAALTSARGRRESAPPPAAEPDATREALNEWLIRRAAARAAQKMERDRKQAEPVATPAPIITEAPVAAPVAMAAAPAGVQEIAEPVASPAVVVVNPIVEEKEIVPVAVASAPEPVAETRSSNSLPEVHVDSFLWESLFAQSQPAAPVSTRQLFEVIQGTGAASESWTPRGMQEQAAFTRLVDSRKPFSGLAVSIGVNENDGRQVENKDLLNAIADYVSTLLRDRDFGCRIGADEFVLVCPGELGADAQRRLSQISERLFDYQLRCIGSFSILFSSGGVDVDQEPLVDAVNGAMERMIQTRRSRKTVTLESTRRTAAAV